MRAIENEEIIREEGCELQVCLRVSFAWNKYAHRASKHCPYVRVFCYVWTDLLQSAYHQLVQDFFFFICKLQHVKVHFHHFAMKSFMASVFWILLTYVTLILHTYHMLVPAHCPVSLTFSFSIGLICILLFISFYPLLMFCIQGLYFTVLQHCSSNVDI